MRQGVPIDRSAVIGVAIITLIGLGAGVVMKPTLRELNGPEGPQILGPVAGPRAQFIDNRSAFGNYRYGVPDHVIGIDWLKSQEPKYVELDPEPELRPYEVAAYEPPPPSAPDRRYEEEAEAEEPSYPSLDGGILMAADAPEPPLSPEAPEPPEAPQALEAPVAPVAPTPPPA